MNPLFPRLNEGHVELNKFPASKVCQLAKQLQSSQATAKHIKQVTRDPMWFRSIYCDISTQSYPQVSPQDRRKRNLLSLGKKPQSIIKMQESHKKREDLIQSTQTDVINVVTSSIEKDLDVQWQSTNVKFLRRLATSVACATRRLKKVIIIKGLCSQAHPRCTN